MNARLTLRKRWWLGLPLAFVTTVFLAHHFFYQAPVLMYHHVDNLPENGGTYVSPESFERQMEFLKVHRYRVIGLSQLLDEIKEGARIPAKTVVITFDDGYLDNIQNAYPVLKKMDFPATIFMITDNIGKEGWLSEEDLRILNESGITIGSHTVHHAYLPGLSFEKVREELTESKNRLEQVLGYPVTLLSYPAGGVTPEIQKAALDAGYEGAVTTNYGKNRGNIYSMRRVKVRESAGNLFNFWGKTSGYYHVGKKSVQYRPDA